jgi:hypothetical protein
MRAPCPSLPWSTRIFPESAAFTPTLRRITGQGAAKPHPDPITAFNLCRACQRPQTFGSGIVQNPDTILCQGARQRRRREGGKGGPRRRSAAQGLAALKPAKQRRSAGNPRIPEPLGHAFQHRPSNIAAQAPRNPRISAIRAAGRRDRSNRPAGRTWTSRAAQLEPARRQARSIPESFAPTRPFSGAGEPIRPLSTGQNNRNPRISANLGESWRAGSNVEPLWNRFGTINPFT